MDVKQKALASTVVAVALGMLLFVASASAYPTVRLTPEFSSGVLAGSGSLNATLKVEGTEYGGFPPPIVGDHPRASGRHDDQRHEPPDMLEAGLGTDWALRLPGRLRSWAYRLRHSPSFRSGPNESKSRLLVESFFAPGGGFNLFIDGHSPVSLEILAHGTVSGNVVSIEVPLVSTVPGAPYASVKELWFRLGETEEQEELDHFMSGVTLPLECPPSGTFSWAAGVTFDEGGANPPQPHTTESTAKTGCPSGQEPARGKRAAEALARRHAEEEAAAAKKKIRR